MTTWDRTLYSIAATTGNVTITLPPLPDTSNLLERGTILFRRVDSTANLAFISAIIGGVQQNIPIPVGNDIYWFVSVLMSRDGFNDTLFSKLSAKSFLELTGGTMLGSIDSTNFNIKVKNPTDVSGTSKDAVNYGSLIGYAGNTITQLTGDVTSPVGAHGSVATTVATVGAKTAAQVAQSVTDTVAATSSNTISTIVKRDASGNFSTGTITASQLLLQNPATLPTNAVRLNQLPAVDSLNVYLSAFGSDSNTGTVISPFLTLAKAESIVTGSGSIWLQTGTYTDSVSVTGSNVGWTCVSNNNSYKCTVSGTTTIAGSVVRRSFKGIQFSTGANVCINHTSSQGILNFENCSFISSNTNGLVLGSGMTSNYFNYFNNCDFGGLTGTLTLADNTNNSVALSSVSGSSTVSVSSGTLTVGTFVTGVAFPGGTLVLASLGGSNYLMSNNATASGTLAAYNAATWYITNCGSLKMNIGLGHLVLGYNNPVVQLAGNTGNYLETAKPIITVVTTQAAMLAQTYATFGGLGCMTKVTSDSTATNNGLWQCVGYTVSSLSSWQQISSVNTAYTAGTGLTLSGTTFSITPQTASRAVVTDSSGNLTTSSVTSATLAFMDATSSVQTQINSLVPTAQNQKTVKVATTAVIALSGLQTIDGVSLVAGDEVLQAQTTAIVNNGIWVVASGAWTRSTQMPTGSDAAKAKIFVLQGTLNAGTIWTCTNATGSVVGTASLAISQFTPAVSALYTNLTAAITNSATTLSVTSTNGFPSTGIVMILNESILYSGKTSNSFTGCTRGYNGTTAVAAVINAYVNFVTEEIPYYKMGADFTTSTIPTRIYRDKMWMSGSATAVRTWTPSQIPWVYTDITAAELSCIYWVQELMTFFKGLENDTNWDQIIGAIAASITSRITGNLQNPDGGTDMDNQVVFASAPTYVSEWFELIVGRNPAGTELYTMSFTLALTSNTMANVPTVDMFYPFRIIWQTTRGAAMAGFNGQAAAASSASPPKCTQYTTSGVTIPAAGFPIWAIPVSIETTF
jgi:hypothetical protein